MTILRKALFELPEGVIYLDGNSLGPLPKTVQAKLAQVIGEEWGAGLIRSWNNAGWMAQPQRVGNLIAPLLGAPADSVMMGDTLSIKVYQALSAALEMRPERRVVLSDSGNFPTDLYMAQGLLQSLDRGYELRIVEPDQIAESITEEVAAVMLTQVDYRSGRMHDMHAITAQAHSAGAVMIWDLAHSAGAIPLALTESECEFAVGCTYKYLNGGPGAPAFIYVRPDLIEQVRPCLSGWLGHAEPFAFAPEYHPAASIERMRVGTPPVLQMAALEAALAVWQDVDMQELRAASIALAETFIREVELHCPALTLASPRDPAQRGSQVSFACAEGYAVMQALISRGVIGDFRAPDMMRFGFTPLYLDENDVLAAVDILADVLNKELWNRPEFQQRSAVT
ncbi:MAG: kynureninase [Thiolinea sp.]